VTPSLSTHGSEGRNGSADYLLCTDNGKPRDAWQPLFWIAIALLFCVANSPPARLTTVLPGLADEAAWAHLKAIIFLICLIPLLAQLLLDVVSYLRDHKQEIVRSGLVSIIIFGVLCLLIFPFEIHRGHVTFERGLANDYANMSAHPFSENNEYFYRRILMPAIGYYLQLGGVNFYPIFALGCTFIMVICVVHFLRSRTGYAVMPAAKMSAGFIMMLSVSTCGFVMIGVQWPGYPEQLAFIFILLAAGIPMRAESRLACVALALLAHDGAVFPLLPIVLFCFPKPEKLAAIAIIGLFYAVFAISYGFNLSNALTQHDIVGARSCLRDLLDYPLVVLLGIVSAFKFYWAIFFAVVVGLIRQRRYRLAGAVTAMMFSFVPMLFLAGDVTRMVNFSFLALLICIVILYKEQESLIAIRQRVLPIIAVISLLTPSYSVALWFLHHKKANAAGRKIILREPGIYKLIADRLPLTLPAAKRWD
jgi:hypothetical protein